MFATAWLDLSGSLASGVGKALRKAFGG